MQIDRPITIAIIIFIIIVLIYFFVFPKYNEFKDVQMKLGQVEAEYNGKYAYYSEVSKIFRQLEDQKETLDKIENAIPPKPQLADLIYFFQQKGSEGGLIIKNILLTKISPITSESTIKDIVFSLELVGNYQSLKNFIASLEKSSRLFDIGNISFGAQVQSSSTLSGNKTQTNQPPTVQQVYNFKLEVKTHSY